MSRRASASIVANPVLVGAVTVLVVVVAVFLAYNANNGLPFVPTKLVFVDLASGSQLVKGNEVREGGFRIGVVEDITNEVLPTGESVARLQLKLDKAVGEVPTDTTIVIRPRSALGLKYVELTRGRAKTMLQDGDTIPLSQTNVPVQFDDVFKIFDAPTREASQQALNIFGSGFAGRGASINELIVNLRPLFRHLEPVARNLSDPDTGLARFFRELNDFTRIVAPIADVNARLFTDMAITFEAFSRDPDALRATIEKQPGTLLVGTRSLRDQLPFLRNLAAFSADLRPAARDLRVMLPTVTSALRTGIPVLPRTVQLNNDVRDTLVTLKDLAEAPTTNQALRALTDTVQTANPLVRFIGPYQTVCNSWNYFWTFLGEHISAEDQSGTAQRVISNHAPIQDNSPGSEGAFEPANASDDPQNDNAQEEAYNPIIDPDDPFAGTPLAGTLPTGLPGGFLNPIQQPNDPATLHGQPYGAAIDNQGRADCENGQRGYPRGNLARALLGRTNHNGNPYIPVTDPHTPGNQGPTFKGRKRVPEGQTFSREPESPGAARLPDSLTTGVYGG